MKKLMYLPIAVAMFAFTACGGGEATNEEAVVEEAVVEEAAVEDTAAVADTVTEAEEAEEATEEATE